MKGEARLIDIIVELAAEELKKLNEVSQLQPEYPGWMLALPSDRKPDERRGWESVAPSKP